MDTSMHGKDCDEDLPSAPFTHSHTERLLRALFLPTKRITGCVPPGIFPLVPLSSSRSCALGLQGTQAPPISSSSWLG